MKTQNWMSLTAIQVGGAICLPVLLIGFELSRQYGFYTACLSIACGNAILFALGMVGAKLSARSEKTTVEHAELYLGKQAKKLFALVISVSMCIWFAIQAQMMAQDIIHMLPKAVISLEAPLACLIGAGIVWSALSGISKIESFANIAVPFMIATMLAAVYQGLHLETASPILPPAFKSSAISLVLATSIAAVVDMPTFFRHAINEREAHKATLATFLIGIPIVEVLGAALSQATGANSLVDALYCFDGTLWRLWILLFILLAGWTTNNANLYSAAMSAKTLFCGMSDRKAIGYIGSIAALFSMCNIIGRLELILDGMGILISSMGGVILAGSLMNAIQKTGFAITALVLGIAAGCFCLAKGSFITNVPIIDALLIASAFLFLTCYKKRVICTESS